MKYNVSGQFLYFSLVSALSGNGVTGSSGFISGRRCVDGGSMNVLSGNIVEDAGGLYHANLYDWDCSGNNIGFYFTASGCVPVSFSVETDVTASGRIFLSSGQAVSLNSGQSVLVYSGQLSGQPIAGLSGFIYIASGIWHASGTNAIVPISTLSGIQPISGTTVTVPISSISGVQPISGTSVIASVTSISSGLLSGQQITLVSGQSYIASGIWPASGANSVVPISTLSGVQPISGTSVIASVTGISSGLLSGQLVTLVSGQSYTASGIWASTAPATVASGSLYLASGSIFLNTFASGVVGGGSGNLPSAWGGSGAVTVGQNLDKTGYSILSGQLSGQQITLTSGQSYTASGIFVTATVNVSSGSLYLASGSIFINTFASGAVGGGSGNLPSAWGNSGAVTVGQNLDKTGYSLLSGTLSGQQITLVSGQSYTASGIFVNATITVGSGSLYLASGSIFINTFASGVIGGGSGNIPSSWGNSGAVTIGQNLDKAGYSILSGQLSGQLITLVSGQSYTASGIFVTASLSSGQVYLSSGQTVSLNSGQLVSVYSGQLSGQPIAGLLGFIYTASGVNSVVPPATLSGIQPISGTSVIASVTSISSGLLSGQQITLVSGQSYTASGIFVTASLSSGQVYLASGQSVSLNSGQSVQVYSGQLSGQPITLLSGLSYTASGIWHASGANVVVPLATLSGIQPISGTNVIASIIDGSIKSGSFISGLLTVDIPRNILKADFSGIVNEATHSLLNAARKLTNKWDTTSSSGFLTVRKEDAITVAYTQAVTAQSGATPITSLGDA